MCIYVFVHCMCTHIYKHWILILFWEGEVGHPQVSGKMHGIRNCSPVLWDSCPSHSHGLSAVMIGTVPKSSISNRTEQFPRFQLQQCLIWCVIIPWRAGASHQIMAHPTQGPVPLKFIATELS